MANSSALSNDSVPAGIAVADLDGDGLEDMAVTTGSGRIVTLKGTGSSFLGAFLRRSGAARSLASSPSMSMAMGTATSSVR